MKKTILAVLLASLVACGGKKAGGPPSEIKSTDDYKAGAAAMMDAMKGLFDESDCDKLAANIKSYKDTNKAGLDSMKAWEKAHPEDEKAMKKEMEPKMKEMMGPMMAVMMKCKDNKGLEEAMKDM